MAPTKQELSLLINPLVPEAVQHNNRVLSSLHSLTAFLLGLSAGILALQSTAGFAFYFAGTVLVSGLFHLVLLSRSGGAGAGAFFPGAGGEIDGSVVMTRSGVVKMDLGLGGKGGFILRKGAWRDVWFGGGVVSEALSGFVLGWAGVGGVLR
ncbi:Serine/threonine-protein phosphatase PP1 [Penicillium atrosanguineum]|uniref:ER membrane protein complex subunit 6 n=1 Tax=Penicillium atrosanguineum TaxID=1132637 RepID=A0A9W9U4D3_9EURO|nr:Serine/threonine-protein phosphatase PP1 [Penicillium atrosanguineum]KAJ5309499.1 Serine/threonine-protein phosphatase PP1 [Penicillium atrosanguineum]KAJ5315019.1 Transmembrane protein 93 [Penicillium atrosanguineum]